ncbi:FkbM family methyltransferase [Butyrivibrio hungatei]|uniref:SAM-dependent methyltransferase n=1 Tax=Butyrivibrio hungatei TaxID=185008 RepID=A0A1D9P482_9FIRM|nr:FkbM family methyltransferase [Butyrivibrio hungatei]AOZ97321.1 SAM-dependent methyltransferase [Butyrivibrio hungatei]
MGNMMTFAKEDIDLIRNKLQDDLSKKIFSDRILFSETSDYRYIKNIVCSFDEGKALVGRIQQSEKIAIFGAGAVGKQIESIFHDRISCFIDNNKVGNYLGIPVVSLEEYIESKSETDIYVCSKFAHEEIIQQLLERGIPTERIINVGLEYSRLNHKQYFDLPALKEHQLHEEFFVDGGGFDGSTSLDFYNWFNTSIGVDINMADRKAFSYIWEPDGDNIKKINERLTGKIDYKIIEKGMWDKATVLKFMMNGTSASNISDVGNAEISVDTIDNMCDLRPTFIKMDIEGAEYKALLGCQKTIGIKKPKLAISIYHKPEDIVKLPKLILQINPDYKLWMRHYSFGENETLVYAI